MSAGLQYGVKTNAEELQSYLKDLNRWTENIKQEDDRLRSQKSSSNQTFPAVRGVATQKSKRQEVRNKKIQGSGTRKILEGDDVQKEETVRISSYDYRSWDKFDVDAALAAVDETANNESDVASLDETEESEDVQSSDEDEQFNERQLQLSLIEKDRGNEFFRESRYNEAIQCYTRGIEADPNSALLLGNRAMALLKQEKYAACEADCDRAIELDPMYVKGYARRGMARFALGKLDDSRKDFLDVLRLEPKNKQATEQLVMVEKKLGVYKEPRAVMSAVKRPLHLRSKKPRRRISVEDIETESEDEEEVKEEEQNTKVQVECIASEETISIDLSHGCNVETEKSQPAANANQRIEEVLEKNLEQKQNEQSSRTNYNQTSSNVNDLLPDDAKENAVTLPRVSIPLLKETAKQVSFEIPKTAYQFETVWKQVRNNPSLLYSYLKMIPPYSYPKLFQQSLEDILERLLTCLHDFYVPNEECVVEQLQCLTKVKRFSVVAMFLSTKEKEVVRNLLDYVRRMGTSSEIVDKLSKEYGL